MENVRLFVANFYDDALRNEQVSAVPRLATLAQAAIESGWGKYAPNFNFFGIKADPTWRGLTQTLRTREVVNGKSVYIHAAFRAYPSAEASFADHAAFLRKFSRYKAAFETTDPREFIRRVAAAGYATDPNYAPACLSAMDMMKPYLPTEAPPAPPEPHDEPDFFTRAWRWWQSVTP